MRQFSSHIFCFPIAPSVFEFFFNFDSLGQGLIFFHCHTNVRWTCIPVEAVIVVAYLFIVWSLDAIVKQVLQFYPEIG